MPYSELLIGTLTLFALVAAFQFVVLPSLVEGFRQRIFNLRRDMFLLLVDHGLRPDEPAYTHLRSTMNGVLRFAERLTLTRLLLHGTIFRKQTQAYARKLQQNLANIEDAALREHLIQYRQRLGQEIVRHVITVSPIAWVLLVLASPVLLLVFLFEGVQALGKLSQNALRVLAGHLSVQGVEAQAEALVVRE